MILIFMGPPGSGKDTQAKLIEEKYDNIKVLSTGDILRDEMARGGELAEEIKKTYDAGLWVPDELVYKTLESVLPSYINDKDIIFTGAIRTPEQVSLMDDILSKYNKKLDNVVNFKLSEEDAVDRLVNRVQDAETGEIYNKKYNPPPKDAKLVIRNIDQDEQAFRTRFSEHRKNMQGIISQYEDRGIIIEINANQSIEEINKEISDKLGLT